MKASIKQRALDVKAKRAAHDKKAQELRSVPQRALSAYEIAAYALLPALFVMMASLPACGMIITPFVLVALYFLYRRFDAFMPFACVCFYGLFALLFNYDILTVIYFIFIAFTFLGTVLSSQLKPYLMCVTVAVAAAILGAFTGIGVVRLAEGEKLTAVTAHYIQRQADDPIVFFAAKREYNAAVFPDDIVKLSPSDEGYREDAVKYLSERAEEELDGYAWYYCIHFGALFGAVSYFAAVLLNRRTSSCNDDVTDREMLNASTRALGGVKKEVCALAQMSVPRAYLWTVLLPAAVASITLDIVGGFDPLSATIMHAFVTLPSAYAFFTIMCYFASLFGGRARAAAYTVLGLLTAVILIFPLGLFICSVVGTCDIILNLRFWTEFIRSD